MYNGFCKSISCEVYPVITAFQDYRDGFSKLESDSFRILASVCSKHCIHKEDYPAWLERTKLLDEQAKNLPKSE